MTDVGILRNASGGQIDRTLRGRRFEEPERRGKWLIAPAGGPALLLHFGMTGDVLWASDPTDRHPHDRVVIVLDRGELRYRNMRKLGGVWFARDASEVEELLGRLGPDTLEIGTERFLELAARRRGRVKSALMDQGFIAGVGNLLADDILWTARIHPARRMQDLSEDDRRRLLRAIRAVVRRTVDAYPGGLRLRREAAGGRPPARCPRCRTPLTRMVMDGRGTYLCPTCQT